MAYPNPVLQRRRSKDAPGAVPGAPPASLQATTAAPAQAQPQQSALGYVNFDQLLAANRPQAQAQADKLIAGVQQRGQAAQQGINQGERTYQAALGTGTIQGGAYTGPKDWAGAGVDVPKVTGDAVRASQEAQALRSAGGIAAALGKGNPGYTAGMGALDAALTQGAGGARLRQAADLYGGLDKQLLEARGRSGGQYRTGEAAAKGRAEQERLAKEAAAAEQQRLAQEEAARIAEEERLRRYAGDPYLALRARGGAMPRARLSPSAGGRG